MILYSALVISVYLPAILHIVFNPTIIIIIMIIINLYSAIRS